MLHILPNSTGTVKLQSEFFDPIGTKVASNWIVIDQIGAVLAKGTVQKSWFAYFCGIFAHFLRGGFAPFFLILGGFGPHEAPNITKQICFGGSGLNWHSLSISASKSLKAPQDPKGCEKALHRHVVSSVFLCHLNRPIYRHQSHCDNLQLILHDYSIFMMSLPCSCRSNTF